MNFSLRKLFVLSAMFLAFSQISDGQDAPAKTGSGTKSNESVSQDKLKVLIVDGQNNHGDWPIITAMMKNYLLESGRFSVDVQRTKYLYKGQSWLPEYAMDDQEYTMNKKAKTDPDFSPSFADYDVVVSNFGYNAAPWPEETQKAFTEYIKAGGGFVSVHAANNSFPAWREYNEMIGLGGWGGRNEKSGPMVYYNDEGELVRDDSKGRGGNHGPQHEFTIVVRDADHPITKGLPKSFLHAKDELYEQLRGPALNMKVLATAYASKKKKGSGRHEPMLMTIDFGEGRIFHNTLGHAFYSMECLGMKTVFLRGTEWAASGKVTIPVPENFPSADKISIEKWEKPAVNPVGAK
jgi:type 1 glutamine amidotransferase